MKFLICCRLTEGAFCFYARSQDWRLRCEGGAVQRAWKNSLILALAGLMAVIWGWTRSFAQQSNKPSPSVAVSSAHQAEVAQIASEAQAALNRGDTQGAINSFERLVKLAPGVAEYHSNLGMAYYTAGRSLNASQAFRQALKLKPGLTHAHFFLGASLADAGRCSEAMPYLDKDAPRVTEPHLRKILETDAVRCSMALNQPDKTLDWLRMLNRDFPDDPDALYMSAHIYSDLSTVASQRLLATAPASIQAHQLNAEVQEMQEKWQDAAVEYRKVLAMNPRMLGIHYRLGHLLLEAPPGPNTFDEARRQFEEELKIDPGNAGAEYELGEMARQARQWNVAIEHFTRAVTLDPDFVDALTGLGKALVSAGRAAEAVAPLERAVKLAPDDPVPHYQLSFAYRRVGRSQDAEKELVVYRQTHDKALQMRQAIRAGIMGRMTQEQTAEPPE
jgi:Flp pilus assembly protein TadD